MYTFGLKAVFPHTRFLNMTATPLPCDNETSSSHVQSFQLFSRVVNTTALKCLKLILFRVWPYSSCCNLATLFVFLLQSF